jgi:hypothetical protein
VGLIIDDLTMNGVMDAARLYESPFTDHAPPAQHLRRLRRLRALGRPRILLRREVHDMRERAVRAVVVRRDGAEQIGAHAGEPHLGLARQLPQPRGVARAALDHLHEPGVVRPSPAGDVHLISWRATQGPPASASGQP